MRFRYSLARMNRPIIPLGGRSVRPRPLVNVSVLGPSGTAVEHALLDTGADDTVFTDLLAARIGVDLTNAPTGSGSALGTVHLTLRYAEVGLRLTDGVERREWRARVGFTAAQLRYSVLGFAGALQFFDAHFRGASEEVELTVNPLYPGI
jgi:hypothetical protein